MPVVCSCGRAEVELGNDLCHLCRADHEQMIEEERAREEHELAALEEEALLGEDAWNDRDDIVF
jgi:hypothetical protein